jgi:cellobiose phosphorylase
MDGGESTVYEKMLVGIDRMIEVRGSHGLPLMGHGDWNDAANMIGAGGKGETVWLGQFLHFVIHEIAPSMTRKGDQAKLAEYMQRAGEIKRIVNEQCWDGEWFIRAFKDDGAPVGAKGPKEGYIWINSQTWAVIGGISDADRLNKCMDSVEKHMGTEYGLTNIAPGYREPDPTIGLISRFRAGWKENAAVFSHASSFNIVARAILGRGSDAVDLFRRLLPNRRDADVYLMEPYVYSQFCAGPDSDDFGQGAFHWLTGTSAWMFRAMCDYIIGVRPELKGLRISPAVAPSWKSFSIRRNFRGCAYTIEFENPDGVETGVKQITLDGKAIRGNLLPMPTAKAHSVRVMMG